MARYRSELKVIALVLCTVISFVVLLLGREATLADRVWNQIAHGENDTGAQTNWGVNLPGELTDTGICRNCHLQHAHLNNTDTPNAGTGYYFGLPLSTTVSPYINATCFRCHTDTRTNMPSWPGKTAYEASLHWTDPDVIWPGSGFTAGTCRNCHDPHGVQISATANSLTGGPFPSNTLPVPNLLREQEEYLCYNCHDASGPGIDIQTRFTTNTLNTGTLFYKHPVNRDGSVGNNDRTPWYHTNSKDTMAWGGGDTARHVECTDCHNPHYATAGLHTNEDTNAGNVLLGAYGARVTYGAPNTYTPYQLTTAANSYEPDLCFRCHSGFSSGLPTGAAPNRLTDVAADFRPNQRAIHPVMGLGKLTADTTLAAGVWVNGWDTRSYVTCSDCHYVHGQTATAEDYVMAVPQARLLRTSNPVGATANDMDHVVCFRCHNFDVYSINGTNQALSRATHPVAGGHDVNSDNAFGVWCMNCHGGGTNGGMHGTDTGVGSSGVTALGDHFMNGAAIAGFTYDAGGGKFECWTRATNAYNLACTQHAGGKQASYNFNYNP